jgi:ketosteroid isomerase-like protein
MRLRTMLVPFVFAAVAACGAKTADTPTTGTAEDEAAIRADNAAYGTAWSARDTTAMFAMMADDYTGVAPDGAYFADKAAAMAGSRTEMAAMPPGLTLTVNTSFVKFLDASHAITGGTWSVAGMPPGMPSTGSWTGTVRKDSTGSWKSLNSLAATFIPPAPAMPDSAAKP